MTEDTPKGDRIAKVLARAGIASRRGAEKIIEDGRVTVNGKTITSPALNVTPDDKIFFDGELVGEPEKARMWLYHKPIGLITTEKDDMDRPTVFENLPKNLPRVMSVGRLDLNSEGLLLLTNDGGVKRELELPSTGWVRKYRVRVKGYIQDYSLDPLKEGINVDGEQFRPMDITLDTQKGANAWLTIGLKEGKNREIRRAIEAVGFSVNRLIRVAYGPFKLNDIKAGAVEEVRTRVLADAMGWTTTPKLSPKSRKPNRRRNE
ncbi:MAG: pseudouridine synthase [Planktomarina sp.]